MINVFILTFCRNIELFYGTELVFKTLRVGFPNAKITVVDNASIPEVREKIESLAKESGCLFEQIPSPGIQHHDFIQRTFRTVANDKTVNGPLVFLDPDICFWECCEDFSFDALMAGYFFNKFYDYITKTITMPRVHTSFLWIPDASKLWYEILKIKAQRFDFEPFIPFSFNMDGTWYRYDTGASLFSAIPGKMVRFTERHLNCYDHLYAGSHIDWLYHLYDAECQEMLSIIHENAKEGNLQALKGMWKYQKEIFKMSFVPITIQGRRRNHGRQKRPK